MLVTEKRTGKVNLVKNKRKESRSYTVLLTF